MSSMQTSRRKEGKRNSGSNSRTTITKTTGFSGAYNPNFHQRMIDNGIYPFGYEYLDSRIPPKPLNFAELQQMLLKRRASLTSSNFSEDHFDKFARADSNVTSENKATENVIPMIQGTMQNQLCVDGNVLFGNIDSMFLVEDEGNRKRLAKQGEEGKVRKRMAKPDVYYGARPQQLDYRVRNNEELGRFVMPSTTAHRPCAPNFFVEAKGPNGSSLVALDQACFVGAIGARGIHSLQTYRQEPSFDPKSYTLTATYHAGQLKMYAHHCSQPNGPGTPLEYYMHQIKAWAMTSDRETCLSGITAFRNAVAWTEVQRNAAIEHANTVIKQTEDTHAGKDDDQIGRLDFTSPPSTFTPQSSVSKGPIAPSKSKAPCQEPRTSASANELGLGSQWMCPSAPPSFVRGGSVPEQLQAPLCDGSVFAASRNGRWVWKDGAYRNYWGNTLVQSQNSQPHDVWVFFELGWPGGDGKQWRCLWSATRQLQFQ